MTPEQLALIADASAAVHEAPDRFASRFYEILFERAPELGELFGDDMAAQRQKFADEISFLTDAATDLDAFVDRARELGRHHVEYGVRPEHYAMVEDATVAALAEAIGAAWGPEHDAAWRLLYRLIAETMLDGAAEEFFSPR